MNLHYQLTGQGQPLLIIHGLFGSSDNWRSMAKSFAKHYQVISVDLRNHGRSPHSDRQDFASMAEDVIELCEKLGLSEVLLLGHSLGGKVVMTMAELRPELIKKLIVVDISPRQYESQHTPLMDTMMSVDLQRLKTRSEVDQNLSASIKDKAVRQFLLMNLVSEDEQLSWRINLPALKANYQNMMAAVCQDCQCTMPALFVYGEQSEYVTEQDQAEIKRCFSDVKFSALDAGHWVHAERPMQFRKIVEDFLADD